MKKQFNYYILFSIILFSHCEKKDPVISNEEELITTVKYILTPIGGGTEIKMSFKDLDGDGGSTPQISSTTVKPGTSYNARLELSNESVNPVDNITTEILEEDIDHQFFFAPSSGLNVTVTYDDVDKNNKPLGLKTKLVTGTASSNGKLKITLRHEPNKSATGVSQGQITNAGGETDIEIEFPISVL